MQSAAVTERLYVVVDLNAAAHARRLEQKKISKLHKREGGRRRLKEEEVEWKRRRTRRTGAGGGNNIKGRWQPELQGWRGMLETKANRYVISVKLKKRVHE